ncbi:MAG: TIGR01777 family oxidoreductase, partial [Candidatus Eisenbacteria bacterium]
RIRESRVAGTRLLATGIARAIPPPRSMICASAVGYYGDRGEQVLDEASGPGEGFLADLARDWEAAAEPASRAGIRVVHLRLGMVLSRDGGALPRFLLPFGLGLGGPFGSGRQWMSWIALDDLIAAFGHALTTTGLDGPVNAVTPCPVTNREFARTLGRVLGRPAWLTAPAWTLRLLLGEMGEELLLASQRVIPERLLASGFEFRHPELDGALRPITGGTRPGDSESKRGP